MTETGIVRRTDDLGRIVIPKEIRNTMKINAGDPLEIYINNGVILLSPCKIQCACCGNKDEEHLTEVNGIYLCPDCVRKFGGDK